MGAHDTEEMLDACKQQAILDEREITALRTAFADLVDAIRLTQEYTQLPALEGWSWYDALTRHAPDVAEKLRSAWQETR